MFHSTTIVTVDQFKCAKWLIYRNVMIFIIHCVSKKLSRFVFVRTASNFHRFW